ncbi:tetratricopeptide repeat protein (plasmid) [Azospirillum oryzae]|uniref:Tetratricopeptide repeat protein n=2 Tax=Azospirillum oryzae TaxID=286727 RepID=A0A6N1ABK0_9PROT|nr:tetratricopeptide repeat protein [Azospirillum oryzae]QKS49095.1 tetratricopeptide repeat protein [Azospirillum oryzae]
MAVDRSNNVASAHAASASTVPAMIDVDAWRRRIREDTFSHYHLAMGVALRRNGDGAAAIERFQAAIAIIPGHALAYWNWVGILHDAGRAAEAEAVHREAIAANPHYQVEALHLEGKRLVEDRDYLAAAERFREAIQNGWNVETVRRDLSDALRWQGVMVAGKGSDEKALPFLEEASQLNATDETLVTLSDALLRLGRSAQAVGALRQALAGNPLLAKSHYALGQHLNLQANSTAAVSMAKLSMANAIAVDPPFSAPYDMLSQFSLRDGQLRGAVNHARHGVCLNASSPMAHFHLGVALIASGRYEDAEAVNAKLRSMVPQERYPVEQHIMIMIGMEHHQSALTALAPLLAATPNDPMTLGCKGHSLFRIGHREEAEAVLRSAVASTPDSAWARLCLGWMLRRTGRGEEAAMHFRHAVQLRGCWVLYEARLCPWTAEDALAAYRELGVT